MRIFHFIHHQVVQIQEELDHVDGTKIFLGGWSEDMPVIRPCSVMIRSELSKDHECQT